MSNQQKSLKSILILILATFMFIPFACEQTIDPLQDEELIKISQESYEKATKNSRLNGNVFERFIPKWDESEVIDLKNGGKIVIAPLQSSLDVTYSNEISFSRKLIVEFDKRMSIKNTEILEIVGTPDFVKKNKNLIIENRNENDIKDFEGGIVISDVNYTTHDGKAFNKGKRNGTAKIANKDKGARKLIQCIDWYWVQSGNWTYLYSTCSAGGEGGVSGSGGGITPVQVLGRLCGTYTFQRIGEGRTAEIHGLAYQAFNFSNNNHVSASWTSMCVTFGNSIQTSNNASIAFNLAWNNTLQLIDVWLKQPAHQNVTSYEFQHTIETILRTQLGPAAGGYSALTIGDCSGSVITSNAQYCQ